MESFTTTVKSLLPFTTLVQLSMLDVCRGPGSVSRGLFNHLSRNVTITNRLYNNVTFLLVPASSTCCLCVVPVYLDLKFLLFTALCHPTIIPEELVFQLSFSDHLRFRTQTTSKTTSKILLLIYEKVFLSISKP